MIIIRGVNLMKRVIWLVLVVLVFVAPASGDMFTPRNSCRAPSKPFSFRDERHYESFINDVERYRNCINRFVDEQNEAANRHLEAASSAIEEWNRFVRWELNR